MPKSINDLPTITQIGIFVLIAVLIGGGVFYYFVFPMFGEKTALTTELTTLRAQNEQSRVVEQQLAEYQKPDSPASPPVGHASLYRSGRAGY